MKLLFDENLSPRLAEAVADLYPGSCHLRNCGLRGAPDEKIWKYAFENDFAIVSKDSDFRQRSILRGSPPKVILLQIGNCSTVRAEFVLINLASRIQEFLASAEESCLVLKHPR